MKPDGGSSFAAEKPAEHRAWCVLLNVTANCNAEWDFRTAHSCEREGPAAGYSTNSSLIPEEGPLVWDVAKNWMNP